MDTELSGRLGVPERIREITGYGLFDDEMLASLDAIAQRSATLLEAPVSLVSVVLDTTQFILGSYGVFGWGTPAEWATCTHTVLAGQPYCVVDGMTGPKRADNPFLQMNELRSDLGVPLIGAGGHTLGSHCVIDTRPRIFTDLDLAILADGAEMVMKLLDAYRLK